MEGSLLSQLGRWLGPGAAEAKIVGFPREVALLEELANAPEQGYLPREYQRTIRYANSVPEVVSIAPDADLMARTRGTADYRNNPPRIRYDPALSNADLANTLSHELLHFLNARLPEPQRLTAQHDVIKRYLGTDAYMPARELKGYQQPEFTEADLAMLRSWFGDAPPEPPRPLREQLPPAIFAQTERPGLGTLLRDLLRPAHPSTGSVTAGREMPPLLSDLVPRAPVR